MDVLASFSGKTLNASAIGRKLLVSHTTAAEWVHDLERVRLLWLVPFYGGHKRPLLILATTDSPASRLMEALQRIRSVQRIYWWKSGGRTTQLVADLTAERVGVSICESIFPRRKDWLPLIIARRRGVIQRGFLLHAEAGASIKAPAVVAVPMSAFVAEPERWILRTIGEKERRAAVWRFNRERLAAWAAHR